jgi:uncharacterized MAPEG superfamily protein
MFVSAYFPLALILFVLYFNSHRNIAISILSLAVMGLAGLLAYFKAVQQLAAMRITVEGIQRREIEAVRNILAYFLPFAAIAFNDILRAASLGVFFVIVGILYVRSNLIHVNPVLSLCGFRVYDITIEAAGTYSLLSKRRIGRSDSLLVIKIGDDLFLEKTKQ